LRAGLNDFERNSTGRVLVSGLKRVFNGINDSK
jgi:hypothetical protein